MDNVKAAKKAAFEYVTRSEVIEEAARLGAQDQVKMLEKAYGGCKKCYGKGYSTYRYALSGTGDFVGDPDYHSGFKTHMVYCTCDRGKQLEGLVDNEKEAVLREGIFELLQRFNDYEVPLTMTAEEVRNILGESLSPKGNE